MTDADPSATLAAERTLVQRCQKGDTEAWDQLFDLHYNAVGRFIFQLIPSFQREDVQEICQETFLSVVRKLSSFSGRSRLQTWIFRIAANKARDYVDRQFATKRGGGLPPLSMDAPDAQTGQTLDPPSSDPTPESGLLAKEQMTQLREALDTLGGPCREIIELRYFADLSYEDISEQLTLNVKTVSSRLSKCLDKLENLVRELIRGENEPRISV